MDLTCRLNQVLQMRPRQEVSQADKFAVILVFHVDHPPAILTAAHRTTANDDGVLATNDGKGDHAVDTGIHGTFLLILLVVVIWVHAEVVEGKFLLDALLEGHALFKGEGVGFGNNGNDVDDVRELLQHNDIDRLKRVAGWLDEEEAAMDAGILNVALSLRSELFS